MSMLRKSTIASVLAFCVIAGFSAAGAGGTGTGTNDCGDGPGGHELTWTPTTVWPPNHQMQTVTLTYTDADPDHELVLSIDSVTHDQMTEGEEWNGAGNTGTDWLPTGQSSAAGSSSVTATTQIRAERSGRASGGRTYTIAYTATSMDPSDEENPQDNDCSGTVAVLVPHDCRGGACKGGAHAGAAGGKAKSKR